MNVCIYVDVIFYLIFYCTSLCYVRLLFSYLFFFVVKSLESDFLYHKLSFPSESALMDVNRPDITRLLKQVGGFVCLILVQMNYTEAFNSPFLISCSPRCA